MHGFSVAAADKAGGGGGGGGRTSDHTRHLIKVISTLSDTNSDSEGREQHRQALEKRFELTQNKLRSTIKSRAGELTRTVDAFQSISANIYESRQCVGRARANLAACREQLRCKREELRRLYEEAREHEQVLELLARVDALSRVPEVVAGYVGSSHFVHAARAVSEAVANFEALSSLSMLQNLYSVYELRETVYANVLERLEHQLYVSPSTDLQSRNDVTSDTAAAAGKRGRDKLMLAPRQAVGAVENKPAAAAAAPDPHSPPEPERLEEDPTEDSARFIALLVEALFVLGKIPAASQALEASFQTHLDAIIFRCTSDVLAAGTQQQQQQQQQSAPEHPLRTLFGSMLQRMRRVVHMHNILIYHMNMANARAKGAAGHVYSLKRFLDECQSVVKFLVQRYMTDSSGSSSAHLVDGGGGGGPAAVDALHVGFFYSSKRPVGPPEKQPKELFSFQLALQPSDEEAATAAGGEHKSVSNMKLVCPPDYGNITHMYGPVGDICTYICEQLGLSLAQCDLHVSLTRCVTDLFVDSLHKSVRDALTVTIPRETLRSVQDSPRVLASLATSRPLHRSAITAHHQLHHLSTISAQLPDFAHLFHDLCLRFHSGYLAIAQGWVAEVLRGRGATDTLCLAGRLLEVDRVREAITSNPSWPLICSRSAAAASASDTESIRTLESAGDSGSHAWTEASAALLDSLPSNSVSAHDLIADPNFVQVLATFNHSFSWLASKWRSELCTSGRGQQAQEPQEWAAGAEQLERLADSCLLALHVELRLVCLHHVMPLLKQGRFKGVCDSLEMDAEVGALCAFVSAASTTLEKLLPVSKSRFLFEGLPWVLSLALIGHAEGLGYISTSGLDRILRDLGRVKTALRGLVPVRDLRELERVTSFFENLHHPPDQLVHIAIERGLTFSERELRAMLHLSGLRFHPPLQPGAPAATAAAAQPDRFSRQLDRLRVIMRRQMHDPPAAEKQLSRTGSLGSVKSDH